MNALLVGACGKGNDLAPGTTATSGHVEDARSQAPADGPTKVAPPPVVVGPAGAKIDCAALVTTNDVEQACGATLDVQLTSPEQSKDALCGFTLTSPGGTVRLARIFLRADDAVKVRYGVRLIMNRDSTEVSGLGDLAFAINKEHPAGDRTDYAVAVAKGRLWLLVVAEKRSTAQELPCTTKQLTTIARMAVARLP